MIILEREQILQKIFSRINASRPQSISITGDHKIGKTVLMQQIMDAEIQSKFIDPSKQYCFYYRNLNEFHADYLQLIADFIVAFSDHATEESMVGDTVYNTLSNIISDPEDGRFFIIVLDNFNVLTQNYAIPLEFFSFLRSLANSFHVAYIISSVCPLQGLCSRKELEESPFFNIFTNIELKTFSEEEGEKLLSMVHPPVDASQVRHLSGFHPYLMKQTVDFMLNESQDKSFVQLKKKLIEQNISFVQDLLSCFPENHSKLFQQLALGIKPGPKEQYIVNNLIRKGYVEPNYQISSEIIKWVLISFKKESTWKLLLDKSLSLFSFNK